MEDSICDFSVIISIINFRIFKIIYMKSLNTTAAAATTTKASKPLKIIGPYVSYIVDIFL